MEKIGNEENKEDNIVIYHHVTFGSQYKQETEAVKKIVERGATPLQPHGKITIRTYSRPNYTASLLMRNNTAPKREHEAETNVIYHFTCPDDACRHRTADYVGLTTRTLRERMSGHRYKGAIHEHFIKHHGQRPTIDLLLNNTKIINRQPLKKTLVIAEAVAIEIIKPALNVQKEFDFTLPSNRKRQRAIHTNRETDSGSGDADITSNAPTQPPVITIDATPENNEDLNTSHRRLRPLPHRIT